jgi:hypothetical protein
MADEQGGPRRGNPLGAEAVRSHFEQWFESFEEELHGDVVWHFYFPGRYRWDL